MTASQSTLEVAPPRPHGDRYGKVQGTLHAEADISIDTEHLVVSPYTEKEHLLDLKTLDIESQLLAISLTQLMCIRKDYATAPYLETFNWADVIGVLRALAHERGHIWRETSFFVVAFRSQIPPTTVYADLGVLDKAAHAEATASGGFLKYAERCVCLSW